MRRTIARLRDLDVKQAKPDENGKTLVLPDGDGLRLLIKPSGRKYWQFRTANGGKETCLQLGVYPDMSLSKARDAAAKLREGLRSGVGPVIERKVERARRNAARATTFKAVAEEMLETKAKNVSASYLENHTAKPMAQKLTLDTLEPWLWESANILRGSIDSSDFKNYIFGLLFLKRFSDVFDERVAKLAAAEGISLEAAEGDIIANHGDFPAESRWAALTSRTQNIGEALRASPAYGCLNARPHGGPGQGKVIHAH